MELRPYQREACDAAWRWLNANVGNCVISLPTGGGKSLLIADLCRQAIEWGGRVVVLANRKELLQQNAQKIHALIPNASLGIYSAGLKFRHTHHDIIVAGIQSVWRKATELGSRQLVIPDECHLIPARDEGMYRTFLSDLRAAGNDDLRVVGMTATPFRTGEGSLCRANGIFQAIAYSADLKQMIADGYLCPLTNQPADAEASTAGLHVRGGEFVAREVEDLFSPLIRQACREIVAKTKDRHSVLIFCAGVSHADAVTKEIEGLTGEACGVVTGGTPPLERAALLERFRGLRLRFLTNVDVLTTGFDAPCIDAIAILRATQSPGLLVQMVGRGLRPDPSKTDCLILDFGQNIKRHGPIDAIDFGKPRSAGPGGSGVTKTCPNCEEPQPASARECVCGFRFPAPAINHEETADTESSVLKSSEPPVTWDVLGVHLHRHKKRSGDGPETLRVDYVCTPHERPMPEVPDGVTCGDCGETPEIVTLCDDGPHYARLDCDCGRFAQWLAKPRQNLAEQTISEWVCLEHGPGFALRKAWAWWELRSIAPMPQTIDEALELFSLGALRSPVQIVTRQDGRWKRIESATFGSERPESWATEAEEIEMPF